MEKLVSSGFSSGKGFAHGVVLVFIVGAVSFGLIAFFSARHSASISSLFCDNAYSVKITTRLIPGQLSYAVTGKLLAYSKIENLELWDKKLKARIDPLPYEDMVDDHNSVRFCQPSIRYRLRGKIPLSNFDFNHGSGALITGMHGLKREVIGEIDFRHDQPFGYIENKQPLSRINNAVSGWAISATGPVMVHLIVQGKTIAETRTGISRQDVASVYKNWPEAANSGFSVVVPFAELGPGTYSSQIKFIDSQGRSLIIKGPVIDNDQSFALVESAAKPIRLGNKNILSGWAVSKTGEASVRIKAQDSVLSTINVDVNRSDVGKVFKYWDYADRSGFQWLVPFRDLPRGRYPLLLEFLERGEVFQRTTGPEVQNSYPIGRVITDSWRIYNPRKVNLAAWVADEDGIASVEVLSESGNWNAPMYLVMSGVTYGQVRPSGESEMGAPRTVLEKGALYRSELDAEVIDKGLSRLLVRVTDKSGEVSLLPGPLVLSGNEFNQPCKGDPIRLYFPGDTSVWRKKASQLQELKKFFGNGCVEVGMQSRVEYLRTTKGREQDYLFDPDFPDDRRVSKKGVMLSTALNELLGYAEQWDLPLMVTLDGGVWADSAFSAPDVDVVDMLEMNERNVQWNQFGRTEPDNALSDLPGSFGSPELARMMSLNWYNQEFYRYKKRNLAAAVKAIKGSDFVKSKGHVSINLDPDQYINPWFYKVQWYDYNPDTLRQFREWLMHEGVYSHKGALSGRGVPDRLTLNEINKIANQKWGATEQIDPPRKTPDYDDPWHQLWTQFKRHLVDLHYDQLSAWAAEAGMPTDNIYTSQTFIQTDVAETIYDRASGWPDEAGVSIEGAKPSHGHLGAILYGAASRDDGPSRSDGSMFDTIQRIDTKWGVVELNPATIAFPEWVADHDASYRTVGNILNAGARFMTPMWGSHMGDLMTYPDTFRSYDAFTGTPFEYQLVWWLLERRNLPVGSVNYPFGNQQVLSADGWDTVSDTMMEMQKGSIHLAGDSKPMLKSPENLMVSVERGARITIKGDWCKKGSLEADLALSDGSSNRIDFLRAPDGIRTDIPAFKGLELHSLSLIWNLEYCDDHIDVIIDNLSIVPLNKSSTTAER